MTSLINDSLKHQDLPGSSLYIVSTPIGNMADLTYRAVYILSEMDGIACEDTRHTQHLLNFLGIHKPLMAIHDHNEMASSNKLLTLLKDGQRWAYVSDAGTPGISDPGAKLVHTMIQAGLRVIPIPGVSAIGAAISVAGITTIASEGRFQFFGFLPTRGRERKALLNKMYVSAEATVFFESPQRIKDTLVEIGQALGDQQRTIMIARELTKKFETIRYVLTHQVNDWLNDASHLKGEFCVVLEGYTSPAEQTIAADQSISAANLAKILSQHLGSKQIAEILSQVGLLSKNQAYQLALETKNAQSMD